MSDDPWDEVAPLDERILREDHRSILVDESGILNEIVEGRGYYSPTASQIRVWTDRKLYPKNALKAESWICIPIFRPDGEKHCEQLRLIGSALPQKYLWPAGYRSSLDIHPTMLEYLYDTGIPILFTEGVKKADAVLTASMVEDMELVTVAVQGMWGWRARIGKDSSIASPDLLDIPLGHRRIFVVSDSDFRTNDQVRRGWSDCATYLSSKTSKGRCSMVVVPPCGMDKQGADDWLVSGSTLESLLGLARSPAQSLTDEPMDLDVPLEVKSGMHIIRSAPDKIPHIITPVLPEQAIVVMAGQSGSLKTWSALSLMLDGAIGKQWIDHPELEQPAGLQWNSLYINKEMGGSIFSHRLAAMARNPRYTAIPDFEAMIDGHIFAPDKLATFDLAKEASRLKLETAIVEYDVRLVILDSLSMSWSGNENDNSEVGVLYSQLRDITERTFVTWLILHHTPKPSGIRKKDPLIFSVRGAGQIVQQCDTALILEPASEAALDPTQREVTVAFAKTRTTKEPQKFLARLEDHDGLYMSLTYQGTVSEARAGAYAANPKDSKRLQQWVENELTTLPALKPKGPGIRMPQLLPLLRMQWPVNDKNPPSESSLRRAVEAVIEAGGMTILDPSRKFGSLLVLTDPDEEEDPGKVVVVDDGD